MSSTAVPAPSNPEDKKENVHVKAMNEHHQKAHMHLRQAHAAAGSKAARMHITQAGMALTSLHKSAKQAMAADGKGGEVSEYDSDANGHYGGNG